MNSFFNSASLYRKYSQYWPFLFIIASLLVSLLFKPFSLFFFLVFPFIFLFDVKKENILLSMPVIIGLNMMFYLFSSSLLDLFSIGITLTSLLIFVGGVSTGVAILKLNKKAPTIFIPNIETKKAWITITGIYLLFFFAFYSRTISILSAPVPILHDPVSHSFWAKKIVDESAINYFYSPGFHLLIGLFKQVLAVTFAEATNILTNTLSSLTVLFWGISSYLITRSKTISIFTAFFALVAPVPVVLYFIAGKNAFIASLPFLALFLWVLYRHESTGTSFYGLLLFVSLTSIGLIHYPVFLYAITFSFLYMVFSFLKKNSSLKNKVKSYLIMVLPLLFSLLFIGTAAFINSSQESNINRFPSRGLAKEFHNSDSPLKMVPSIKNASSSNKYSIKLNDPYTAFKSLTNEIISFYDAHGGSVSLIMIGFWAIAGYYLINLNYSSNKKTALFVGTLVGSILLLMMALRIFEIRKLSTTFSTGILLLPIMFAIPLAVLFRRLTRIKIIYIVPLLLLLSLPVAIKTYEIYKLKSQTSYVDSYDLDAYEWINEHIPNNKRFVGMAGLDPNKQLVVFSTDGSLWLPVFTENNIAAPFHEVRFNALRSNINYEYIQHLRSDKEPEIQDAINYFVNNNYTYLYVDGKRSEEYFNIDLLIQRNCIIPEYSNADVSIYQLSDSGCLNTTAQINSKMLGRLEYATQ